MSWSDDFLALVGADPEITLTESARRLQLDYPTFQARRRARKDVLARESEIRSEHRARKRLELLDAAAQPDDLEPDLPWHLERFLALYRETRGRVETVCRMREEGFETTWADVLEAMAEFPNFRRVFGEILDEDVMEVEDAVRAQARGGKLQAARMVLQAEMPNKYGNRVRVDVNHTHQLLPEHRAMVDGIKRDYIAPPKPRRELAATPEQDIVEAEYVAAPVEATPPS